MIKCLVYELPDNSDKCPLQFLKPKGGIFKLLFLSNNQHKTQRQTQ